MVDFLGWHHEKCWKKLWFQQKRGSKRWSNHGNWRFIQGPTRWRNIVSPWFVLARYCGNCFLIIQNTCNYYRVGSLLWPICVACFFWKMVVCVNELEHMKMRQSFFSSRRSQSFGIQPPNTFLKRPHLNKCPSHIKPLHFERVQVTLVGFFCLGLELQQLFPEVILEPREERKTCSQK